MTTWSPLVLSPCFTFYTAHKHNISIIRQHNIHLHLYSDDTQLYLSFKVADMDRIIVCMDTFFQEVKQWMTTRALMLE